MDGLGRELDPAPGHPAGHLGDAHGLLRHHDRSVAGQHHAGGEAPGALVQHPDREPEVLAVRGALELAVADGEVLVADPLEPEVGVVDAEVPGPRQRGLGEAAVGEGGEGRVDPVPGVGVSEMEAMQRP